MKNVFGLLCCFFLITPFLLPVFALYDFSNYELVDTITVFPDGLVYYSSVILDFGTSYLFVASGAYKDSPNTGSFTDAIYYTKDGWITYHMNDVTGYEGLATGGIFLEEWDQTIKPWGEYNPNHVYTYTYVGSGEKIGFWIYDSYYPGGTPGENGVYNNDSGSLIVEIYVQEQPDVTQSLVGYWKCDEGAGNILNDLSGNKNDGIITGAQWVKGISNSALRFTDRNSYVTFPFPSELAGNSQFSVSLWVYIDVWPSAQYAYIIHFGNYEAGRAFHVLLDNDGTIAPRGTLRANFWDPSAPHIYTENTYNTGVWYNWVFIYDKTRVTMYENGTFLESMTLDGPASVNLDPLGTMMLSSPSSQPFMGIIDEVKIYSYALTSEQIMQDYLEITDLENSNTGGVNGVFLPVEVIYILAIVVIGAIIAIAVVFIIRK